MCKLMVGVRTDKSSEEFANIIYAQEEVLKQEKDGIGAMIILDSGEIKIFRSVKDYDDVFREVYGLLPQAKLVALHTRTKTIGSVDIKNVHFFEDRDMIFAHNGIVSKFSTYGKVYGSTMGFHNKKQSTVDDFIAECYEAQEASYTVNPEKSREEAWKEQYKKLEDKLRNCSFCDFPERKYCQSHARAGKNYEDVESKLFDEISSNATANNLSSINALSDDDLPAAGAITVVNNAGEDITKKQDKKTDLSTCSVPPSDTLQFLRAITTPVSTDSLKKDMETHSLWGITFLYDKTTNKMYFSVKNKAGYMLTDKSTYSFLFSYDPETDYNYTNFLSILGVMVAAEEEKVEIPTQKFEVCDGVYELTPNEIVNEV